MFYRDGEAFSGGGIVIADDFGDLMGDVDMEDLV